MLVQIGGSSSSGQCVWRQSTVAEQLQAERLDGQDELLSFSSFWGELTAIAATLCVLRLLLTAPQGLRNSGRNGQDLDGFELSAVEHFVHRYVETDIWLENHGDGSCRFGSRAFGCRKLIGQRQRKSIGWLGVADSLGTVINVQNERREAKKNGRTVNCQMRMEQMQKSDATPKGSSSPGAWKVLKTGMTVPDSGDGRGPLFLVKGRRHSTHHWSSSTRSKPDHSAA